jgi:hypothetical protein
VALSLSLCVTLFAGPGLAPAAPRAPDAVTGVEGVAALRGELLQGVVVLAFAGPGPGPKTAPLAISAGTDANGRFRLELKPGSHHLVAVRSAGSPWPFPGGKGDLFCYYLGNPILVESGKLTRVAFNMVHSGAAGPPIAGQGTGIAGQVLFEDKPLARAYVQVYSDAGTNFRGMGVASVPTGEDGRFAIKLPPGVFFVVARKRRGGGMYGPPGRDDYVGYHPGNPVTVRPGEITRLALETATRVDTLEEVLPAQGASGGWFEGSITEAAGQPAGGLYVLFYTSETLSGTPAFVAGPTDSAGHFRVRAAAGTFHVVARSNLGGPLEPGEWYGKATFAGGGPPPGGIRIKVARHQGK